MAITPPRKLTVCVTKTKLGYYPSGAKQVLMLLLRTHFVCFSGA
jgi:hypothetical protein